MQFCLGPANPYHFAINIPSTDFAKARAWLAARVPLLPIPGGGDAVHWRAWNAHACYFRDPDGNIGELIARHGLAEATKTAVRLHPFGPQHFLGISEIGLALADVGEASALLQENLKLPVWDAGDGEKFRALGGERGLLICVRHGHAWFPSEDTLAKPAPLEIHFGGAKAKPYQLPNTDYRLFRAGE